MTESNEGLPVAAQLKRWSKSGLIEDCRIPDQGLFQTEEFDAKHTGDLLIEDLYRAKDVRALIQDKIEKLHNLNIGFQEEHRDVPYPVKENIDKIKEELLDELEGELPE